MPGTVQLVQLARILGVDAKALTLDSARRLAAAQPGILADAFFREAADNDDVTSIDSALRYIDSRLTEFAGIIGREGAAAIRAAFSDRLRGWA